MKDSLDFRRIASLLGIIAIAVVFTLQFGPGSVGCQSPIAGGDAPANTAATVNGREITLADFSRAYRNTIEMYRSQGINEQLARQLGLHRQVLDQLINTELLAQAAEKHGITPSDEELARLIHENPSFHKDGRFDLQTYKNTLRDWYGKTDVEFEREVRRQLAAQKMLETVESTAVVSEDEVRSRFLKEGNKAQVTFVRFAPTLYADKTGEPSPEERQAFRESHQKEIADYYAANKFLYHQPEQVRARHILIKVEEGATDEQKQAAKEKIANLRKEIVEGNKDFAELAKQYSEDVGSKAQGGDLGFNTREAWVKPFADAAFALEPGEISEPVETQYGVHLIRTEEKKPPQSKSLEDVQDEIATQLWKKERAKELAKEAAEKALAQAKAGEDLKALFPEPGKDEGEEQKPFRFTPPTAPVAVESGEFNAATESIPRLGPAPGLLPEIFARTEPGLLDKPYEVGDAWVVVNVTARTQPSDAEFEAKKEELTAQARQAKQFEVRDAYLKSLKKLGDVRTNEAAIDEFLGPSA